MADPLWINADGGAPAYAANELRQAMALGVMYDGRNVGGREGVRPGGNQLQVSLAGSTITVQPGVAYVDPGLTTTQGGYWAALPAAENPTGGPLEAADATNPRKDIVVARVYDDDEDSSGLRLFRSEYIAGTPNPSPAEPAVPSGAVRLATIDVPQSGGGSAVVTNNAPFTVAPGGILPVRTQAERDALDAHEGLCVWRMDRRRMETFTNSAWRTVTAVRHVFATPGSGQTWTKPLGAKTVWVRMRGAGGGGGGAVAATSGQHANGGGGGQGAYAESWLSADSLGATAQVNVGTGGNGGVGSSDGGFGSGSSFNGTTVVASGGSGGNFGGSSAAIFGVLGGAGGQAGTGDIVIPGEPGGYAFGGENLGTSGQGGGEGGGIARTAVSNGARFDGADGTSGGGGSGGVTAGGASSSVAGGRGGHGWVVVVTFL